MNLLKQTLTRTLTATNSFRNYQILNNHTFSYKSAISLENLYPNSSLKITTPTKPECSMSTKFSGYIPIDELDVSYTKSSGPGGQNVNKVNTKVNLRFQLSTANWLHDDLKNKLKEKLKGKITKEGFLIFTSDLTRSQQMNLADCLNKLRTCILDATYEAPSPTQKSEERIRKRFEKAARERLIQKRDRSETKAHRRTPTEDVF